MEVTRLLNEERPGKMARSHVETIYMGQSAALESRPRSSAAWRPHFRHNSTEAGQLEFECRWPSCDHRSSTVEADAEHLQSHIVRRHSDVFHTRVVAKLRDEADAASPRRPSSAWCLPARVHARPQAPAPSPCPSPGPPCSTASDSDPTHQQWRTSRPRTGNRIPLDQRTSSGDASPQFKCAWPDCSYVALRRSHLMQHELTHTGNRPFVCSWKNCTYRASRSATLAEHIRTHTGQRPFKCTFPGCNYAAAQKTTLSSHMRRHRKRQQAHAH